MSRRPQAPDSLRIELAHALGFPDYPTNATAEPYLNYITNRHVGRGKLEGYLKLVIYVVNYFASEDDQELEPTKSIQGLLDTLLTSPDDYFSDTKAASQARCEDVEDTILYIIGAWTLLLSSFVHLPVAGGARKIALAYSIRAQESRSATFSHPYEEDFLDELDSLESLHVAATRLNTYTLSVFGAIDIVWIHNISRHMLLCKRGGRHVLEIFALPCALDATSLTASATGITSEYAQEVRESYSILFNAWSDTPPHARLGKFLGVRRFCWCWSCSAHRHRSQIISRHQKSSEKKIPSVKRRRAGHASEVDPLLIELMENESSDWTPELFPSLWSRIMILEEHLQNAKPWNIWILFRDRRDTLQFWTFFFASVVVLLTIVQVFLGVAQVVGSFK
ncbi:hypothetical protein DE146DRAFT_623045 [Phaeosphaeria sp. MPI-PUGE-AT-0046c]|nr:hypothetical protein DE146DRAFT_623045 [Phaeosphaeria sp. MPI-PUGE-AT-0046c]